MKLTNEDLRRIIKEEMSKFLSEQDDTENETEVPPEVKKALFDRMKKRHQVPEGASIEDGTYWEIKEGEYGFKDAIKFENKYYYGEI